MSDFLSNLIDDLHTSFMQIYQAKPSALPMAPILAYEPIGIPISDAMFKLQPTDTTYNTNLALERFSNMTNIIGIVTDGTFQDTGRKLDNMLEELAFAPAMPASGLNADIFGKIKGDALQMFDPTLGSSILGKDARFHPTYPTPSNWYDPAATGIWHTYNSDASKTTVPPPGPKPPVPVSFQGGWRVLPPKVTPVVDHQPLPVNRFSLPPAHLATGVRTQHLAFAAPATGTFASAAMLRAPIAEIVASPAQQRVALPERELTAVVLSKTTPQPVTAAKITIGFDYCLVTAERDWLSDAFLASKGWYIPGMKAGDLSTGTVDNNTGLVPFVPIAMILVRNLNISGSWTAEDTAAISTAAAIGPFNLMDKTIDQRTSALSCPGVQLLAWLCQVQPLLPPESDPALVAATATPAPVSTVPSTTSVPPATLPAPTVPPATAPAAPAPAP